MDSSATGCVPWIAVVGPTASGKTGLAVELAQRVGGEVISTDSMQVYRYLDIGTSKPTVAERGGILHHLIDVVDPDEPYSAGQYAEDAQAAIASVTGRGRIPILCGGTGLYFRALFQGLAPVPPVPPEVRRAVAAEARRNGLAACYEALSQVDPVTAVRLPRGDQTRILRGLEVYRATGNPLSAYQSALPFAPLPERLLSIGIDYPRPMLRMRIAERVSRMFSAGWVEEVRGLLEQGYAPTLKPLQSIGYREITQVLLTAGSLDGLEQAIAVRTRQYAKRQETWFRSYGHIHWEPPSRVSHLLERAEHFLADAARGHLSAPETRQPPRGRSL